MENYYETSDLGLAASLVSSGFDVVKLDKSNPRRVVFAFERTDELEKAVSKFWSNDLLIPASKIVENIRQLKNRIYG